MAKRLRKTVPKERLSPSEWEIMRICWRLGACTVHEVLKEDLKKHRRDYRTILTFMSRMAGKGWLKVERAGRRNTYSPTVQPEVAMRSEIRRFLEEVVGEDPEGLAFLDQELSRSRRPSPRGSRRTAS